MKKYQIFSILFLTLFSCKDVPKETDEQINENEITITQAQFDAMHMKLGTLEEKEFENGIQTNGKIDVPPQNRAKVTTFLGGYVKSTNLLVGDKVVKGQALLQLESTEFIDLQKEYLEVFEQMSYLKSEYERQKTLYNEKITSQKNYLKAESDYKKNQAMYQGLKSKLNLLKINIKQVEKGIFTSKITIYSPISGDIVIMNANVGMYVAPSDVILEIVATNHLHLELNVFEKDILKIKEGQKIKFKATEASNEILDATVHLVGKSIEGKDRTINIHGHLSNNVKQKLLTGMFVEATIITNTKKAYAINNEAIATIDNKNFVLLLKNKNTNRYLFEKILINKGAYNENFTEIVSSKKINRNSKILTSGIFDILN